MHTFEVLREVNLRHVVVDLASLGGRNVGAGVIALIDELFEKRVDIVVKGLTVQSALHLIFQFFMQGESD